MLLPKVKLSLNLGEADQARTEALDYTNHLILRDAI